MIKSPLISIVDDDESVRESLRSLIRSVGFEAELFGSAEAFLMSDQLSNTNCLILDLRMPGMSGLALQRQLPPPIAFRSYSSQRTEMTTRACKR
jgi:FixJ family two-component response regulator